MERLKLKLQYFDHLMRRSNSLEKTLMMGKIEGKKRRGQQRIRWLVSITNSMDMNLNKFWEIVEDRGAWHAAVHRVAKSQTWLSDWTTTIHKHYRIHVYAYVSMKRTRKLYYFQWEFLVMIFNSSNSIQVIEYDIFKKQLCML